MPAPTLAYNKCTQCPRACGVNRSGGERGFCGESVELRAAVACLHFGEEPPITVFGGSGAIFFTGCTLRCAFCQNYQISQQGLGMALTKDDFIKICLDLQNAGAENINLITGSHHIPLIAEYIAGAKAAGLTVPFCWNSSAYESVESLELLKGLVDIWLPDLKTLDAALSKKLFAAADYPDVATKAIAWMIENHPLKIETTAPSNSKNSSNNKCIETTSSVSTTERHRGVPSISNGLANHTDIEHRDKIMRGVIVRHLFLPGRFEDTANVLEWLKQNADGRTMISLMSQYTPVPFKEEAALLQKRRAALSTIENRLVNAQEDADLQDIIAAYNFEQLFYQELSDDTTWLPDFTRPQPFSNNLAKVIWHC